MSKSSKKKSERAHAKRRARERFGESFSNEDLEDMVRIIKKGEAQLLEKQSLRVKIYRLNYKGADYKVAYDKFRGMICTFLPSDESVQAYKEVLRGK